MNWLVVKEELQKPLDPAAIKPAPQGKYGDYVEAYHVIREANRIFGEDGWSYEVTRLELTSRIEAGNGNVRVGYLCGVRVNVDGVIREGLAVGIGTSKPDNEADAHESAVKEAETDAMKRALRSFGNTFGLALYEKDKSKREVAAPRDPRKVADWIISKASKAQTYSDVTALKGDAKVDEAWKWLTDNHPPMGNEVTKAINDAANRTSAGQAPQEAA